MAGIVPDRHCQGTMVGVSWGVEGKSSALLIQAILHQNHVKGSKYILLLPPAHPNIFPLQTAKKLLHNELALAVNCGMTEGNWEHSSGKHKIKDFIFQCGTVSLCFPGMLPKEQLGKKLREVAVIITCHTGVAGKGDQIRACQSDRSWGRWHRLQSKTCQSQKGEQSIKSSDTESEDGFFPHTKKSETLPCSCSKWKIRAFSWSHWIPAYLLATNEKLF